MDLDTFLTTLYVLIDDWFKQTFPTGLPRHAGGAMRMNDSEVLTVALAGQWRVGVPWQSERGVVRYMLKNGRGWFPTMLHTSAFNDRVRHLWAVLVVWQQWLAQQLEQADDVYEVLDSVPLPICSLAQASRQPTHWVSGARRGHGGTHGGWYFGKQVLACVSRCGVVSGWVMGRASTDDRWLAEALLSRRHGQRQLVGPAPSPKQRRQTQPSEQELSPALSAGRDRGLA